MINGEPNLEPLLQMPIYMMASKSKQEKGPGPASVKENGEKTIVRFQQCTGQRLDGVSWGPDDLRRLLDAHYAAQTDDIDASTTKEVEFQMNR